MARRKQDPEAMKAANLARELADARERATHCGEPTYHFQVGDQVRYGAWAKAVIAEVVDGGRVYLVHAETTTPNGELKTSDVYQCWVSVRPAVVGTSHFSSNDDIKLRYSNRDLESLLFTAINFGINFEPDYQRGYVWEDQDREALLDSIFMGADIGRFVLRKYADEAWTEGSDSYEIVDGKQRLLTLLDYYQNRFPYKGVYYNDLSPMDRRKFMDLNVSVAEVSNLDPADTLRLFLMLNRGGRPVSDRVIRHAQDMLYGLKGEGGDD